MVELADIFTGKYESTGSVVWGAPMLALLWVSSWYCNRFHAVVDGSAGDSCDWCGAALLLTLQVPLWCVAHNSTDLQTWRIEASQSVCPEPWLHVPQHKQIIQATARDHAHTCWQVSCLSEKVGSWAVGIRLVCLFLWVLSLAWVWWGEGLSYPQHELEQ